MGSFRDVSIFNPEELEVTITPFPVPSDVRCFLCYTDRESVRMLLLFG